MKIYINDQYEILSLDKEPNYFKEIFEVEQTREEMFGNWCDACIQGYKYEPQCEFLFNKDGSNARDEKTGELLYKLDEKGNKIQNGYACYPFVDYRTLMLIQKQYEDSQKQTQSFGSQISHLATISGIGIETSVLGQTPEELKEAKKAEMNAACGQTVCNGITVELSTGFEHFSLTQNDQLNLFGLQVQLASGAEQIVYHADGQPCRFYPAADISWIIEKAMFHTSYHITYGNSLKTWIDSVKTEAELQEIYYGADIPVEHQSEILKIYLAKIAAMAREEGAKQ
ncbi:hypothetical protein [Lacrimispora brassicae]